jgi:hypothetical protein
MGLMKEDTEALRVHLVNPEDIKVQYTEEIEPSHFISNAYLLPAAGPISGDPDGNINDPVQILQLDPMRKEAIISVAGSGNVYFAHSYAQAMSLQQAVDQAADGGFLVTAPCTFKAEGTGPLWAITQNASGTSQTVVSASASPAAGAAGSATLPLFTAGNQYLTGFTVSTSGNGTAAGLRTVTVSNVQGAPYTYYIYDDGGLGTPTPQTLTITYPGLGLQAIGGDPMVAISALTNGSSSQILVLGTDQGTAVTVGVLQSRRGM